MNAKDEIEYVYVTESGKKYHFENCHTLHASKIKIKYDQALLKYKPCLVCTKKKPPLEKFEEIPIKNKKKIELEKDKKGQDSNDYLVKKIYDKKEFDEKLNSNSKKLDYTLSEIINQIDHEEYYEKLKTSEDNLLSSYQHEKLNFEYEEDENYKNKGLNIEKITTLLTPLISANRVDLENIKNKFYYLLKINSLSLNKIKLGFCVECFPNGIEMDESKESSESEFYWMQVDKLKKDDHIKVAIDLESRSIYLFVFNKGCKDEDMRMKMELNKNFKANYTYTFSPCICLLTKGDKISLY